MTKSFLSLLFAVFCLASLGAQQLLPGTTPVGQDAAPVAVAVPIPAAGTLDSVRVLTQGGDNLDFKLAAGGSCAVGQNYQPGQTCTVNVLFHPLYPGERRGAVLLMARGGAALGQRFLSARATGSVNVFVPGTITTVVGNQNWIYAGDGQPAISTNIFLPFGVAVDAAGNLYLADSSNNRIRRVDAKTQLVSTIAGTGNIGSTGDGGPALQASLSNPSSIVLDPAGNLYFADSGNNAVRRIDVISGTITTVAGTLTQHGYAGDGGPATAAILNTPNGIAFDAAGNLYLADTGNHVVRRVNAATGTITTVAGIGSPGYSGEGLPATQSRLNSPWSVSVAPTGELLIADQNNHRIRFVSLTGAMTTLAGTGVAGFAGDKGPAAQAQLNSPASVALDVAGNLYIADSGNNRIRKVNPHDATIQTVAGIDGESFSGDLGPADMAGLYGPYTLALDNYDNLFIADVFHNRIRKIASNQVTIKFPPIRVGRVSDPIKQTVENDGNAPLNFASFDPSAHSALDPATTTCAPGQPLAPLATCVAGVQFAPTVTGDPVLGRLALNSDAGNSAGIIIPSGTVLDIDPTTLTLASSANPAVTGTGITFTGSAASAGTTPTGSIVFTDLYTDNNGQQSTIALGTITLSNGSGSIYTTALAAGQHSVTVSYSGDSSNASATSKPLVELIKDAQAPTATTLTASGNPVDAGAPLVLTAIVATKIQGAGSYPIAGKVTFTADGSPIGTALVDPASATLDRALASITVTTLTVGSHTLVASYAGNANDTPSTSAALTENIRIATAKLSLTPSINPAVAGGTLSLTATASSTGGVPTGSITFTSNGSSIGTAPLNGQGVAVLQLPSIAWVPGTYSLAATYAGDLADSPAASQPVSESVVAAGSVLTLASSLNPAGMGAQIVFSATAASNGGTPSGNVTFFDGSTPLGSATLSAAGLASFSTSGLTQGTHSITVAYKGDAYDSSATSTPLSQLVTAATTAVALATSKSPALFADTITLSATVTGTGSTPSGTVSFLDGGTQIGSATLDPTGHAQWITSTMTIGDHVMSAVYSGDTNHGQTTSAAVPELIQQATALNLQPSSTHTVAGLPITVRVTVRGTQGQPVTGTITLTDGATTLAALQPDATGLVTYTWLPAPGAHTLAASYAGDHQDAASVATSQSIQTDGAITATTVSVSANPVAFGSPLTLTANVVGNGAIPGGTVNFLDGAVTISSAVLNQNGVATLSLTTLGPGLHAISAAYGGDTNDSASQSQPQSVQVALHTTLALTASNNPALLGDLVTLTLTAANGSAAPPTGSVVVSDNGTALPASALVNGTLQIALASPAVGTHTLTATYAGDLNNSVANAQPLILTITLRPSVTALTASSTALGAGQQLILISVVQAQGASPATGTVTFLSGSTVLGSSPLSPAGVATLTLVPSAGALNITAHYSGDTLYAGSTSAAVGVTVGPPNAFTLTPTPAAFSLQAGEHATSTLALVSNPNFHDDLAIGCAGLPTFATCQFSTDRLTITPGLPQQFTVTIDTGNPLGAGKNVGALALNRPLACLLPLAGLLSFALRRRRRLTVVLTALLLAVSLGAVTGCATQFSQSTTAPGDYSIQVVATGTTTHTTQTATIHLTVTK